MDHLDVSFFLRFHTYLNLSSSSINSELQGIYDSQPLWTFLIVGGALKFSNLETNEKKQHNIQVEATPYGALSVLLKWRYKQ